MSTRHYIECTTSQFEVIRRACELIARVNMGQLEFVGEEIIGHELANASYSTRHIALCAAKTAIFDLDASANFGIHNNKIPDRARVAWDIAKVIRASAHAGSAPPEPTGPEPLAVVSCAIHADAVGVSARLENVFACHAGRTMFVLAWADYEEACGRCHSGEEFFDAAPETPVDFVNAGWKFLGGVDAVNEQALVNTLCQAARADGVDEYAYWNPADTEAFAYGLTMSALHHGVSWFDNHAKFPLKLPRLNLPELDDHDYPEPEDPS